MNTIHYCVLEYARSETQSTAQPFLVALKVQRGTLEDYGSVILDEWKSLIPEKQQADIEYVEDVLYDLRQQRYMRLPDSQAFFGGIANLNSGPIRTGLVGECPLDSMDHLHELFLDDRDSRPFSCTPERFASVLAVLHQFS